MLERVGGWGGRTLSQVNVAGIIVLMIRTQNLVSSDAEHC